MPWKELERRLSNGRTLGSPSWNAGGDGPAWSRKRQPFEPADPDRGRSRPAGTVPYAELHCHSNFSFLDGASHPEELAEEAARLGLEALALTDHDGLYGVVRFAEAARAVGAAHGVRGRADPRRRRPAERRGRSDGPSSRRPGRRPGGVRPPGPGHQPGSAGGGEGRAPLRPGGAGRDGPGPLVGAHGAAARGRCPAALVEHGPAAAGRELPPAGGGLRARSRGGRAVGPRGPAGLGPQRRPGRAGRPPRGGLHRHRQRALRHARPPAAGHRAGRGAGPPQPGRAGPLAAGGRLRPPPFGSGDGPALRPVPRGGRAGGGDRPGGGVRPGAGGAGRSRRSRAPTATPR